MLDKKDAKCYDMINQIGQFVTIFMMYTIYSKRPLVRGGVFRLLNFMQNVINRWRLPA